LVVSKNFKDKKGKGSEDLGIYGQSRREEKPSVSTRFLIKRDERPQLGKKRGRSLKKKRQKCKRGTEWVWVKKTVKKRGFDRLHARTDGQNQSQGCQTWCEGGGRKGERHKSLKEK